MRFLNAVLLAVVTFLYGQPAMAQQRPLRAEDPRIIPNRALDVRAGFGWEQRAVYPISGIEGQHVSLFPTALSLGVGDRAEFQFEGTIRDHVKDSTGLWHHDF